VFYPSKTCPAGLLLLEPIVAGVVEMVSNLGRRQSKLFSSKSGNSVG